MGPLEALETKLDELLNKKVSVKIPPDTRKGIAASLWWIALVMGVIQLLLAWNFWSWGHRVDHLVDYVNSFTSYYAGMTTSHLGAFYYVALLTLAIDGVLALVAAPKLKAMRKEGWNLLFYAVLLNVLYGLIRMFAEVGGGIGQCIQSLVISALVAYLLFQVRDSFVASKQASAKSSQGEPKPTVKK